MKPFVHDDFLLGSRTAARLYHEYAEDLPVFDYHSHLHPRDIAENRKFASLTDLWLAGDHYKWRAMRANGISEHFCTGHASDREKFQAWAETVPNTLGNPLYHWTHLELQRYFGIRELLNGATAGKIWDACTAQLADPCFSARGLLERSNVRVVCTTDDPTDSLEYHRAAAADPANSVTMLPTFRPDKSMAIDTPEEFQYWLGKLETASGVEVKSYGALLEALHKRHGYFHEHGCRLSDHGLETAYADLSTPTEVAVIFARVRKGKPIDPLSARKFKAAMLYELGIMNHERGWVQQYHLGALRNVNTRMFRTTGPDTGFDSIGDPEMARPLGTMLAALDDDNRLAKTILYNLNPRDNAMLATMAGNFQDGVVPGKIQVGSAWWFLDQKHGIEQQLESLALMGLLSRFVGMVTDSRCLLSYSRHEYFRRVLCNKLGGDMEQGLLPDDLPMVGGMVAAICYGNARAFFGIDVPEAPVRKAARKNNRKSRPAR